MNGFKKVFEVGELFDCRYRLLSLLSEEGGSGDVWLALDTHTINDSDESGATKVVIKIYRPKNLLDIEGEYQFRNEFKKVFGCHHEHIIQPTYFSIYNETPYLVLPYCPAGSAELLIGHLNKSEDLWKFIFEVASGLAYLHEHSPQIIHQDIKPANVLIDDNGNYAITDFGISARMGGEDALLEEESGGTFAYMAPERFEDGASPLPQSDIWALGATLYEIITGDAPFGNDGGSKQSPKNNIPPIKQPVAESIKELVYQCLDYDPSKRPTATQIVNTVLKKRYSKNKSIWWISLAGVLTVAGIVLFGLLYQPDSPEKQLDLLKQRADSIVMMQIPLITGNIEEIGESNIDDLTKATQIYFNILQDAPEDYLEERSITQRNELMLQLISELKAYLRAQDLANKALRTELIEEYETFSIETELHKGNILNTISRLNE